MMHQRRRAESEETEREARLAAIRQRLLGQHPGEMVVFGEGNPLSQLVLVGEAPGAEEAAAGRPFVGAAGKLLSRMLASLSLAREDLWITNLVKERPTQTVDGRTRNRAPTAAEARADLPFLLEELTVIQPRVVVCLGNTPANSLIHPDFRMLQEHGLWFAHPLGFQITATFHPAFILRQSGPERDRLEDQMLQDLATAAQKATNTTTPRRQAP